MTQITKTQVFSQIVDQKEHKNNWYKFWGKTSRFQYHPTAPSLQQQQQPMTLNLFWPFF